MIEKNLGTWLERFPEVTSEHDGFVVHCPAHSDSSPSLRVALDNGNLLLHCRAGCSKGDVLGGLGMSFPDLFDWEAGNVEIREVGGVGAVSAEHLRELADWAADAANGYPGSAAEEYAAERFGISRVDAERLMLGYSSGAEYNWNAVSGRFNDSPRLTVPFLGFDGRPRGLQGRTLGGSETRWCGLRNPQGAAWTTLAVMDPENGLDYALVTEGPSDALTAYAQGFLAVAVRGAALGRNPELRNLLAAGLQGRKVIVCGDNDRAGQDFTEALSEALAEAGLEVYRLRLPDGVNDLNEWRQRDTASFGASLTAAVRDAARVGAPIQEDPHADSFLMTDLGNARRLRAHLGGLVRFVPEIGFLLWDGRVWVHDKQDRVRTAAHEVSDAIMEEGLRLEEENDTGAGAMLAWARRTQSTRNLDSMIRELSALPGVAVDTAELDSYPELLCVANGVVDLSTGDLSPHEPRLMLTKLIDVRYDPEAKASRWEQFLREVFPGEERDMPGYIQRLVGYGITGHTSEQCFAVLYGRGANGKSVFTDTLSRIFEDVSTTTPFSTFEAQRGGGGIPNDVAALLGARLVFASEGDAGSVMAESVVKRLTGQDLVTARFMRKEFFSFRPTFLILLATNHKPRFKGADEGLWRRVKLIPFKRYFAEAERDHYLVDKLQGEAEGILAWAVRGASEWFSRGLQEPKLVSAATEEYKDSSDALSGFYPGKLQKAEGSNTVGLEVYRAYLEWCDEQLMPEKVRWTQRGLYSALEERGLVRYKGMGGQTFKDIAIDEGGAESGYEGTITDSPVGTLVEEAEGFGMEED